MEIHVTWLQISCDRVFLKVQAPKMGWWSENPNWFSQRFFTWADTMKNSKGLGENQQSQAGSSVKPNTKGVVFWFGKGWLDDSMMGRIMTGGFSSHGGSQVTIAAITKMVQWLGLVGGIPPWIGNL